MKYPLIFEANREVIKDPDLIYPRQMLRIPKPANIKSFSLLNIFARVWYKQQLVCAAIFYFFLTLSPSV